MTLLLRVCGNYMAIFVHMPSKKCRHKLIKPLPCNEEGHVFVNSSSSKEIQLWTTNTLAKKNAWTADPHLPSLSPPPSPKRTAEKLSQPTCNPISAATDVGSRPRTSDLLPTLRPSSPHPSTPSPPPATAGTPSALPSPRQRRPNKR